MPVSFAPWGQGGAEAYQLNQRDRDLQLQAIAQQQRAAAEQERLRLAAQEQHFQQGRQEAMFALDYLRASHGAAEAEARFGLESAKFGYGMESDAADRAFRQQVHADSLTPSERDRFLSDQPIRQMNERDRIEAARREKMIADADAMIDSQIAAGQMDAKLGAEIKAQMHTNINASSTLFGHNQLQDKSHQQQLERDQRRAELEDWSKSRDLSRADEMYMNRLQNGISALEQDWAAGRIDDDLYYDMVTSLRTKLSPYEERQRRSQAKAAELRTNQMLGDAQIQGALKSTDDAMRAKAFGARHIPADPQLGRPAGYLDHRGNLQKYGPNDGAPPLTFQPGPDGIMRPIQPGQTYDTTRPLYIKDRNGIPIPLDGSGPSQGGTRSSSPRSSVAPRPFSYAAAGREADAEADVRFPLERGKPDAQKSDEWRAYRAVIVHRIKQQHDGDSRVQVEPGGMPSGQGEHRLAPPEPFDPRDSRRPLTPEQTKLVGSFVQMRQMVAETQSPHITAQDRQQILADIDLRQSLIQQYGRVDAMPPDVRAKYDFAGKQLAAWGAIIDRSKGDK